MKNPVWAYGGGLLAIAGAAVLMGMNISAALGGDPAPWPTALRVGGAALADVGAACLPFAVMRAHSRSLLAMAAFLLLIWAGSCAYTVYAATEWTVSQAAAARDPFERAQWKEVTAKSTYEQRISLLMGKIKAADDLTLRGDTRELRANAANASRAAAAELQALQERPPALLPDGAQGRPVAQPFAEWPWFWPAMLLIFSQAGWAVLTLASASGTGPSEGNEEGWEEPLPAPARPPLPARAPLKIKGKGAEVIPLHPRSEQVPVLLGSEPTVGEQVCALAARGLSQTAIAAQLGIARATVQRHLKKVLMEKTVSNNGAGVGRYP